MEPQESVLHTFPASLEDAVLPLLHCVCLHVAAYHRACRLLVLMVLCCLFALLACLLCFCETEEGLFKIPRFEVAVER